MLFELDMAGSAAVLVPSGTSPATDGGSWNDRCRWLCAVVLSRGYSDHVQWQDSEVHNTGTEGAWPTVLSAASLG